MKKITIFLILTAIVILTSIGISYAQSNTVRLAYKFPPGTVTKYRITQKTTGTKQLVGSSTITPIDIEMTSVVRVRCIQVRQDGSLSLAIDTESGTLKLAGKPSPDYQPPKDVRSIQIAPSGQLIAANQSNSNTNDSALDIGSVILTMVLPDKPVAPGTSWQTETPLPFGPNCKLHIDSTFTGIGSISASTNDNSANIKQTYTTPINPNAASDGSTMQGNQEGDANITFSANGGYVRSAEGTLKTIMSVPSALPTSLGIGQDRQTVKTVTQIKLDSRFTVEFMEQVKTPQSSTGN